MKYSYSSHQAAKRLRRHYLCDQEFFTCRKVRWNAVLSKWITGSEDGTIRIWVRSSCTV